MPEVRIRKLEEDQPAAWEEALASSATFTALDAWSRLVRQTYGYAVHRFEAVEDDQVTGILALTHVRHPIFGNYLATAPFGSYGGFAFMTNEARDGLLAHARRLSDDLGVSYCVLRFLDDGIAPPAPWVQHPIYAAFLIDLSPDPEALLAGYSSNHRNHIRKSRKRGFSIRFGRLELLDDVYEAIGRSMHELGSPYHSKDYLRVMAECLGKTLEFAVVYDGEGRAAGGGTFIFHGDVVTNLHANILRDFRSEYAGEFLYWSVIERYCLMGFDVLDLGRSLNGSGNETYKMKWRPRKAPLAYWYYLPKGGPIPELNQKSAKFQLAIRVWKLLPSFVVRILGPHLIRGIV